MRNLRYSLLDRAVDDGGIPQDWAIAGAGVVLKSSLDIEGDLAAGRLETF